MYPNIMNENVTEISLFDDPVCPITKLNRPMVKTRNGIKYKIFHGSVMARFYEIYPDYKLNSHGKGRCAKCCFINELFYGKVSFDEIDETYLVDNLSRYNPLRMEYYMKKSDGDIELAKQLFKERQSTTSKNGFIKKHGSVEGGKRYEEHFKKLHSSMLGENHWTKKIGKDLSVYLFEKFGYTSDVNKNYKHLSESEAFLRRSENSKKWREKVKNTDYFDEMVANWKSKMQLYIRESKKNPDLFFKTYGCWKSCYKYSESNNIPYTDENRVLIWRTLFDRKSKEFWKNKGLSDEAALEKSHEFFKFRGTSKSETSCFNEIETELKIKFERQYPIGEYSCDAVFLEKHVVLEFFGDYWHKNPSVNRFSAEEILSRKLLDDRKVEYLEEMGYNVYIIWENTWKCDKISVIEELKSIL
jgi:very-short-patch-repair endonuclease